MTAADISSNTQMRRLLSLDDLHISVSLFAAAKVLDFDLEALSMDSEALIMEVEMAINHQLSPFNRSKLLAAQAAFFTDLCYRDLPTFIDFANLTLATDPPVPGVFNPANVLESAAAVLELAIINSDLSQPASTAMFEFSKDILAYWGVVLVSEGAAWAPPPLQKAIMPARSDFNDTAFFGAVEQGSQTMARALNQALWEHGKSIFDQLKQIKTADGAPAVRADEMKSFLTSMLGEFAA